MRARPRSTTSAAADPEMLAPGRRARVRLRAHAHRGAAPGRPARPRYDDVVAHLGEWFAERIERAAALGVDDGADRPRPRPRLRPHDRRRARDPRAGSASSASSAARLRRAVAQGLPRRGPRRLLGGAARRPPSAESATIAAAALAVAGGRRDPAPARRRARSTRCGPPRRSSAPAASPTRPTGPPMAAAGLGASARRGERDRARPRRRPPRRRARRARPRMAERRPAALARPRAGGGARARRDRDALLAPGRGARGRARGQRDRHQRHRLGQVAVVQPAGPRRARRRPEDAARSTSTRPRRSPRTRPASSPSSRLPGFATRSTTATRRARIARRFAGARTWCSPTRTCSTSASSPHHKGWGDFFANLRWVVVDEAHTYRGVFGSHVANVLRRLRRVAARLRRRAALHPRLGDDRQPGRAGRAAGRQPTSARRLRRRAAGRAPDRDLEPAGDRPSGRCARRSVLSETAELLADLRRSTARGRSASSRAAAGSS